METWPNLHETHPGTFPLDAGPEPRPGHCSVHGPGDRLDLELPRTCRGPLANDLGPSVRPPLETVTPITGKPSRKPHGGNMFPDVSEPPQAPWGARVQCSRMT